MQAILDGILTTLVYLVASFVLFVVGKLVYQLFHRKVKVGYELVENDNLSFSFAHVGYFIGLLISIGSAVLGESYGLVPDLINIGIYGVLAIVLLNLSIIINDKILLPHFDIKQAILKDKHISAGIVEGANAIAIGLVVLGAIHGEGYGAGGPVVTAILYWLLGQAIFFLTTWIYNLITPYNIHEHIAKNNVAVAVGYAGAIISIANLIRFALTHDFDSWVITLEDVGIDVAIGLIFLPIARLISDKILLPGQSLTDEIVNQEEPNVGAALVEAFSYIGGSMLIVWAL